MFRVSPDSSQIDLLSNIEQFLRQRDQEKLNDPNAWHNVFLDQVTKRIPEERFSVLFDEDNGRPNAPIRVLVAMLIIKEGFGWSDEQLFEAIHFNLVVRRAPRRSNKVWSFFVPIAAQGCTAPSASIVLACVEGAPPRRWRQD